MSKVYVEYDKDGNPIVPKDPAAQDFESIADPSQPEVKSSSPELSAHSEKMSEPVIIQVPAAPLDWKSQLPWFFASIAAGILIMTFLKTKNEVNKMDIWGSLTELSESAMGDLTNQAKTYASDFFKRSINGTPAQPTPTAAAVAPTVPVQSAGAVIMQQASSNSFYLLLAGIGVLALFLYRGKK